MGRPSERSFELFFLASYDLDGFRDFISSPGFGEVFELDSSFRQELLHDEVKLLKFAFRLLKQVLFGERTIPLRPDAVQKRSARYRERLAQRSAGRAGDLADAQDRIYENLGD